MLVVRGLTSTTVLRVDIDRDTGAVTLNNGLPAAQDVQGYAILSSAGTLSEANYTPLADGDANWVQFTAAGATSDLSEGHLATGSIAAGASISLDDGVDGAWLKWFDESDITFEYLDGAGELIQGNVTYVGATQTEPYAQGDLNFDGAVDGLDWLAYSAELGNTFTDLSDAAAYRKGDFDNDGVNGHADFLTFKGFFDAANGAGAFAALVSVPEPTAAALSIVCLVGLFGPGQRRRV